MKSFKFLAIKFFLGAFLLQIASAGFSQDSTEVQPTTVVVNTSATDSSSNFPNGKYPYHLPIWGQKVQDIGRGDNLQLPFGFSVMYVNSSMDLELTEFSMTFGDNPTINDLLAEFVNAETLNFSSTVATVNGLNYRADAWILPFFNVYGMFTQTTGSTTVSLQPTWHLENGETIQTQVINSSVEFQARSFGIGNTWAYGVKRYFASVDYNYTWSSSELLTETLGLLTASGRVGRSFKIGKKMKLSAYIGAMYRDFSETGPNSGSLALNEALPGLEEGINTGFDNVISRNVASMNSNTESIADLETEIADAPISERPDLIKEQKVLEAKNVALTKTNSALSTKQTDINESGVYETDINYSIKKELISPWSFQFGFNFEVNKHFMLRGEYGVSEHQRLLLTGINYRFGFKKKS